MAAVVSALFQRYVPPPEAVSVALAPLQIMPLLSGILPDVSATAIDATGRSTTVTVAVVAEEQLFASVTVTV